MPDDQRSFTAFELVMAFALGGWIVIIALSLAGACE